MAGQGDKTDPAEWYDHGYWKDGIDIGRWGAECQRGLRYSESTGAPVAAGTPGVVRKFSTGRKHRGSSSGDLLRQERLA
jgi:hypothetical protein